MTVLIGRVSGNALVTAVVSGTVTGLVGNATTLPYFNGVSAASASRSDE
jgi:hypothetical protein